VFKTVEAEFKVANFQSAVRKAKGLADVHILFDRNMHERGVNVKIIEFEIHDGCNGKEVAEASHLDDHYGGSFVQSRHARWLQPLTTERAL
jgi:alanine racemase